MAMIIGDVAAIFACVAAAVIAVRGSACDAQRPGFGQLCWPTGSWSWAEEGLPSLPPSRRRLTWTFAMRAGSVRECADDVAEIPVDRGMRQAAGT